MICPVLELRGGGGRTRFNQRRGGGGRGGRGDRGRGGSRGERGGGVRRGKGVELSEMLPEEVQGTAEPEPGQEAVSVLQAGHWTMMQREKEEKEKESQKEKEKQEEEKAREKDHVLMELRESEARARQMRIELDEIKRLFVLSQEGAHREGAQASLDVQWREGEARGLLEAELSEVRSLKEAAER